MNWNGRVLFYVLGGAGSQALLDGRYSNGVVLYIIAIVALLSVQERTQ